MDNKTAIGLVGAVVVVGILLFAFGSHVPSNVSIPLGTTTAPTSATSSPHTATSSNAAVTPTSTSASAGTHTSTPAPRTAPAVHLAFDVIDEVTSNARPTITGTANTDSVVIVINNSQGVGIAGAEVPVVKGKWSYNSALSLPVGTYMLQVAASQKIVSTSLTITAH